MPFSIFRRTFAAFLVVLATSHMSQAQDSKLTALLQKSPSPANSVLYMHLPSLKKLMTDAQMNTSLNDSIQEVWGISQLDKFGLRPKWEAGYATLTGEVTLESLEKAVNGYVDTVANEKVVWSPRQAYMKPMAEGVAFLRPADRPLLASWLKSGTRTDIPPYLVQQAAQPEQYLSLLLAVNLEDTLSPVPLAEKLKEFKSLEGKDTQEIAQILASARGLSIIVGRNSLSECILSIDFGNSPALLAPVAGAVLSEILERNHSPAPEVAGWASKVDGNKLSFKGAISEASLDGVLSIFSLKGESEEIAGALSKPAAAEGQPEGLYESQEYFKRVNALIERVRKYDAQTTGYRAKWNDTTARRIDELGTLGVDPQLIDYGSNVSSLLRGNALNIRGVNIGAGQEKANESLSSGTYYGGGGYYGGYGYGGYGGGYVSGYYDPNRSTDYQRVTDQVARGTANLDYRQTLSQIDQLTANVRKAMTDKYKVQF